MLAIHAALLALRAGRPVRMVYDRHEDIAATTKRHPAVVTHRTGRHARRRRSWPRRSTSSWTPARTRRSRRWCSRAAALHAGGPYAVPERPDPGARDGDEHAAERRLPRLRRAADGVRGRDAGEPRRRGAGHLPGRAATPLGVPGGRRDADGPGPARERGGGRGARGGGARRREFERRARADRRAAPGRAGTPARRRRHRDRRRPRARLARRRLHRQRRGRTSRASRAWSSPRTGAIRVLIGLDGDRPGLAHRPRAARGRRARRRRSRTSTWRPQDTSIVPNSGPTVASRTTMVVGGPGGHAPRGGCAREVEAGRGGRSRTRTRDDAREHGPSRVDERFDGYPGIVWDDETYRGDAYPCVQLGRGVVAEVDVDLDTGEVAVRRVVQAVDARAASSTRSSRPARSRAARSRPWGTRRSRR